MAKKRQEVARTCAELADTREYRRGQLPGIEAKLAEREEQLCALAEQEQPLRLQAVDDKDAAQQLVDLKERKIRVQAERDTLVEQRDDVVAEIARLDGAVRSLDVDAGRAGLEARQAKRIQLAGNIDAAVATLDRELAAYFAECEGQYRDAHAFGVQHVARVVDRRPIIAAMLAILVPDPRELTQSVLLIRRFRSSSIASLTRELWPTIRTDHVPPVGWQLPGTQPTDPCPPAVELEQESTADAGKAA